MFEWYVTPLMIVYIDDEIEHLAEELFRRRELDLQDTTLVMNSHADLNLLFAQVSLTLVCSWNLRD
jgi:hypothetical protein